MFTPTPMGSFRSARKFKDSLVRAKLHPIEKNIGSRKCNKIRCEVLTILKVQISFLAELLVRHKINHYFNCDSKCLAYLITCRTYKQQYTCDAFQKRWNKYRCCARKVERGKECKQK